MALRESDAQSLFARLARLLPQELIDTLISRFSFWPPGVLTAFALFIEQKRRREEFAMYVLPKALESAWAMAVGRGWAFETGGKGHILVSPIPMFSFMILDHMYAETDNETNPLPCSCAQWAWVPSW